MYIPLVDHQFGYVRYLVLDLAGSVLSFLGRSLLSFVSPIRQRASLVCHASYMLGCATHF